MKNLKVTLIQTKLFWESIDANIEMFDRKLDSITENTDLIILPEMFSTGFSMNPEKLAVDMNHSSVKWLTQKAVRKNADIAGSIMIRENGRFFNRLIWAKPNKTVFTYDKKHLFRIAGEEKIYSHGNKNITVELNGWKIRPFICYDLRFPIWTRNINNQFDIAVFTANWPKKRSLHWNILLKARAVENQCYVIGVNRVGKDGNGFLFKGDSQVISPKGRELFHNENQEVEKTVELSYKDLIYYRKAFPVWKDGDNLLNSD